jgi:large subunit ribosomal protein L1
MPKAGKKYRAAAAKVEEGKLYNTTEAVKLVKETSITKFDGTVECHIRLNVDPRHADQQVRGVVVMPNGLGKTVRILVFADGEGARIAREAGADIVVDSDEWIKKIQDGFTDFDVAIATPDQMGKVGRLGKVLGPRGLMPNPKAGTVAMAADLPRVLKEARAGRVEFRLDKTGNIHVPVGKVSFDQNSLEENLVSFLDAVTKARPAAVKGTYMKRVTLTSTMGPGIRLSYGQSAVAA